MKRLAASVFVLLACRLLPAQSYGNEWIRYDKPYWRFNVAVEGIYRIDSTALAGAGFPVSLVDPRDIQIFARGEQIPIYIEGEADGEFNASDFIELHALKNDAWMDAELWENPAHQHNPYYSLINDTLRYYITWDATPDKKRVVSYVNTDFTQFTPRPWFWSLNVFAPTTRFLRGVQDIYGYGASSASYVEGEGYFNHQDAVSTGTDFDANFTLTQTQGPYTQPGTPDAQCRFVFVGVNDFGPGNLNCPNHHAQVFYGANNVLVADTAFKGRKLITLDFPIPTNALVSPNMPYRLRVVHDLDSCNGPTYTDRMALGMIQLRYPRSFNLVNGQNFHLYVPNAPGDPLAYIEFNQFVGTPLLYAYGDTVRRITPTTQGGFWKAIYPQHPNNTETDIYAYRTQVIVNLTDLRPVNGNGYFTDFSLFQPDSAMVVVTHTSLMNGAMAYKQFRESSPVNPHQTVVADVEELYDQFGGGIAKHPLSIRRFLRYAMAQWPTPPRSLFLIGKSVQCHRVDAVQGHRQSATAYAKCLVPTYGYPPSDAMLTLGLGPDPAWQDMTVGRLSALTEQQVYDYVGKLQSQAGFTSPEPWMKNILHFRGGSNAGEAQLFGSYLSVYRSIAQDTSFVGRVSTFVKGTGQSLGNTAADSVRHLIENEGTTLMTFFAHASGGGFDITIDQPANYQWNGKHPAVIGNSCYAGNIHLETNESASERFVIAQDKGAIAFMASVDIGLSSTLFTYTSDWYRSLGQVNYGGSIGDHMRHAIKQQLSGTSNLLAINNAQTMALHGDPAVVLYSWPLPDFSIRPEDVIFLPEPVIAELDSFTVRVVVRNLGRGIDADVGIQLRRTLVEEQQVLQPVSSTFNARVFQDTVEFRLPVLGATGGGGLNLIEVRLDLDPDVYAEVDDQLNNVVSTTLLIGSGQVYPVFPYEFAVIPDAAPTLKASTGDPFAPARPYRFEVDTTDLFNSPLLESTVITAPGGVINWQPASIFSVNQVVDSAVFFWRCARDSAGPNGYDWRESSFQYIPGREGWGQDHFFQFKGNSFQQIDYQRPGREFHFFSGSRNLRVSVKGNDPIQNNYFMELDWIDGMGCQLVPALHVAVIDPATFTPWGTRRQGANPNNYFGNANDGDLGGPCAGTRVYRYFSFQMNNGPQLTGLRDMLQNSIPQGHYVLMWTYLRLNKDGMDQFGPPDLYTTFDQLGATGISAGPDSIPYIFFTVMGDPATAQQIAGDSLTASIDLSVWLQSAGNSGRIGSPLAGPTTEWKALYWDERPDDPQDSVRVKVYGVTPGPSPVEVLLFDLPGPQDSVPHPDLGATVDATIYPYVRLVADIRNDSVALPYPSQLQRWHLLMSPVPECAIDPPLGLVSNLNGIAEGIDGGFAVAVHNISPYDMDSLLIDAWVVKANGQRVPVHHHLNAPLPAGGVVMDTIRFSTWGMGGVNALIVEANPIDSTTGRYHQLEQYHFNNIAQLRFVVDRDEENPLLDVTFDGVHILDGDIVSARPEIVITLDDENTVLLMNNPSDTAYFKVFLTDPGGATNRVHFRDGAGNEIMRFVPASGPENIARIEYRPVFTLDGRYRLTVQATDVSLNQSGEHDHRIAFEVINRPTITDVLNYPNPFTTSTRFVFTVTGSEAPTYMKVQIMTITGRVVREVGPAELGALRVGRNITDFAWDGTDQFGDRLARGVYLYRVIAKLHGEDIELRETGASQYFRKGFGKMYLLR